MSEKIGILIVDDHQLVRKALCLLLSQQKDFDIVGEAGDGEEAITQYLKLQPDIILMDLFMPKMNGQEAIKFIKKENPTARILVLTTFNDDKNIFDAIEAGADGYFLKDTSTVSLSHAIRNVYKGKMSLQPRIAMRMVELVKNPPNSKLPLTKDPLTAREMDVLQLIAKGLTNQLIANQLNISYRTVSTHVSNILNKLHVANRTEAALYAIQVGLTNGEEK